ncbi:MAG TPA: phage holin family protein [Candidatus Magasanikbacteria bacterium]|nr:phage holin family protein [Candidatus Magasanikbacteria bacterium]
MRLILRWLFNAATLVVLAYYLPGIAVSGWYAAIIAALVLGLVNALIRPILILLTLPVNILTLGLFTLVINALMFWFVGTVVKGFVVAGFWPAFWGALIMSLVSWVLSGLFRK